MNRKPRADQQRAAKDEVSVTRNLLSEGLKPAFAALVAGVLGGAAFWFVPLRDKIQHVLYTENAELRLIISPSSVRAGDEFEISVTGKPISDIPISPGTLEVKLPAGIHLLSLRPGKDVAQFGEPAFLTGNEPFRVWAANDGTFKIEAILETRYGKYDTTTELHVEPISASGKPTKRNFSGRWNITLGTDIGYLDVVEPPGSQNFTGRYQIGSGGGTFYGQRDGKSFDAELQIGESITRWSVRTDRDKAASGDALEFEGTATKTEAQTSGWIPIGEPQKCAIYPR